MMMRPDNYRIAYFISPHGFGHAARAAAVMEATYEIDPTIGFEIFTQVPRWFFHDSLSGNFRYHSLLTDIGLVQKTPLKADLAETIQRLNHFLPLDRSRIRDIANLVKKSRCQLIICDISPMGIVVAKEASIPSLLVENFTWDWIYQGYLKYDENIIEHTNYLKEIFDGADFRIQTEPVCHRRNADLTTFPVSRKRKTPAREIRKKLRISETEKTVLISMGGIAERYTFFEKLTTKPEVRFVIPTAIRELKIRDNLVLLPHHSGYFHPDLVNACDAVIGKAGYSTLAEIYYAGVPFGYIARGRFRESQVLVSYIERQMKGLPVSEDAFHNGSWLSDLPDLLVMPKIYRECPRGAEQVAHFVYHLINSIPL